MRRRAEADLEREIAHHLHELTAGYERQGYSPEEARRLASRTFGNAGQIKEDVRDEWWSAWLHSVWQDIAFGARTLRRTPVVTLAVVLSLALGIGANTAILSLMDVVLWRDLPVPSPKQLTLVHWRSHGYPAGLMDYAVGDMRDTVNGTTSADYFSHRTFQALRDGVAGRASVAAYTFTDPVSLSYRGHPTVVNERPVSGEFFTVLQVHARLGRVFSVADDSAGATPTVVLSHQFWDRELGANPAVIGQTLLINNAPYVIIGVVEPEFRGLNPGDPGAIYVPLHHAAWMDPLPGALANDRFWGVLILLRRASGVTNAQLQPMMSTIYHATWSGHVTNAGTEPSILLEPGNRGLSFLWSDFQHPLLVIDGLAGLLLGLACVNIMNLLLARAVARRREVAMRLALGCSRARLMRQLMTESALLAISGGIVSIAIGYVTANLLGRFALESGAQPIAVPLDARILFAAAATTGLALLAFGLFPAWRAARVKETARHTGRTGKFLIVGQMGMSVVLVLAAVIFTRNLLALRSVDPGFDKRNLIIFGLRPSTSGYTYARLLPFYLTVEQRLASTPGVAMVGVGSRRPLSDYNWGGAAIQLDGSSDTLLAQYDHVTPGFLSLFSPVVTGRTFTWAEVRSGARVAVISSDLARRLGRRSVLGEHGVLGHTLAFVTDLKHPSVPLTIIGIVPTMARTTLTDVQPTVWLPMDTLLLRPEVTVAIRTTRAPYAVVPAIRQAMREIDPDLPLVDLVTMEQQIASGLQREQMFATLCNGFGLLALLLSVVGLYGVMAYQTSRRRGEIGIRLALGARPRTVAVMVLRDGVTLVVTGVLAGLPLVWLGARYAQKELTNMKALEPLSLSLAIGILLTAALAAIAIPALRASGIQPMEMLRRD
jgi:predicted permease